VIADVLGQHPRFGAVEAFAQREREGERGVRRVRANAVELRKTDQQRDDPVHGVGGLEGRQARVCMTLPGGRGWGGRCFGPADRGDLSARLDARLGGRVGTASMPRRP